MNRRASAIIMAALLLLAVSFFFLWQRQQPQPKEMVQLCQNSAAAALEDFHQFEQSGSEADYWSGVAEFKSFLNAFSYLREEKQQMEYLDCNQVYGVLLLNPEKAQQDLPLLLKALELLGRDYTDPNGYLRMNELKNQLIHG